jgi:hypothetical protein
MGQQATETLATSMICHERGLNLPHTHNTLPFEAMLFVDIKVGHIHKHHLASVRRGVGVSEDLLGRMGDYRGT